MTNRAIFAVIATASLFAAYGGRVGIADAPLDAAPQESAAPSGALDASDATLGDASVGGGACTLF